MRCLGFVFLAACGARTGLGVGRDDAGASPADASLPVVDASPPPPDASPPVDDCGASLASGPSWSTPFGAAQHVCLSPTSPANCPGDALVYGHGTGWPADISQLGGATWIWRPGISISDPSDLVQAFARAFKLHGLVGVTLSIAADDFAQVVVNGAVVGSVGSKVDSTVAGAAQSSLTTFDLGGHLVDGSKTITIIG